MDIFKVLETEINSIVQKVSGNTATTKPDFSGYETEKLQGLLNNIKSNEPLADFTQKKAVSQRVNEPEVQRAIQHYNNLTIDERTSVMDSVSACLQDKLMNFMEANGLFTENIDNTNYMYNQVLNKAEQIANRKSFTEKEMAVLTKDFQRFFAKCNIEEERVLKAFTQYRGEYTNNKNSETNKDEFAINLCSRFKQAMTSYHQLFISNIQEILKNSESSKPDFMNNLSRTLEKIESELTNFQNQARDIMNAYIPEAVQEENRFARNSEKYIQNGLSTDFCLSNKVIENTIIDTLLEKANSTIIPDAA